MKTRDGAILAAIGIVALVVTVLMLGSRMLSKEQAEFATAIVDKLVLGGVIVAVGHYFAKRLEEHKVAVARESAYAQWLADHMAENSRQLRRIVSEHYARTRDAAANLRSAARAASGLMALRTEDQLAAMGDYAGDCRRLLEEGCQYLPADALVTDAFWRYETKAADLRDVVVTCEGDLEAAYAQLGAAWAAVVGASAGALLRNPFAQEKPKQAPKPRGHT